MEKMPEVFVFQDGTKMWEQELEDFVVKVYLPETDQPADIVNFGFRAPYLMVFEEDRMTFDAAKAFADAKGFAEVASEFAGSVAFFYPLNEGGWEKAPADLYAKILAQSRISQYYRDGVAIMYDRFAKKMGKPYIRGAVLRTYLYGCGNSADYIAKNCLQTIMGDGLYGTGDVTPAACILQNLSVIPMPQRRDIPVVSVGNDEQVNATLQTALDHFLIKEESDVKKDFRDFVGNFRRMVGNLEKEADLEQMGMCCEPGYVTVKTSPDNRGDDKDTKEHRIGYVAYYNRGIMDAGKKAPLLMCFHGGGDSAFCMAAVSGWYRVAAKYGFLLISVENHLNSTATETIEMIGRLKEKYQIDETRIYASGFSMGGCKSWDMMQEYPKVYAAVAPMDATFEVGYNSYGEPIGEYNQNVLLPVFYAGGEITPLPELPFQAQKCVDRMGYVCKVNRVIKPYDVKLENKENWENPIWGVNGDFAYRLVNAERENSVLTLQLFVSEDGNCYSIFGSVSNQGHEVRHHTCENAWKFLSQFRRLPDGSLEGGEPEKIKDLYNS
ncbi:MAG: hypothetical protein J1E01_08515 [Acetatifactor sp.]|nr:hypothetical protein [Acetatifactor sp.]